MNQRRAARTILLLGVALVGVGVAACLWVANGFRTDEDCGSVGVLIFLFFGGLLLQMVPYAEGLLALRSETTSVGRWYRIAVEAIVAGGVLAMFGVGLLMAAPGVGKLYGLPILVNAYLVAVACSRIRTHRRERVQSA
jgi:hypothetical protein